MAQNFCFSRRKIIKSSLFGLLTVSTSHLVYSSTIGYPSDTNAKSNPLFHRYPSIDDAIVAEVVGASHFNFERVKELVTQRPELARATWDWAFGDWETALGAASHVGRRDIAKFLMDQGARPDIFTFAMFGRYEVVKAMLEVTPHLEKTVGPHGISLLNHAKAGLRTDYGIVLSSTELEESKELISFLEQMGTADPTVPNLEMTLEEKKKYLGDYRYGEGANDGFSVKLNMRNHLSLGKLGNSGGALFQKSPNTFTYNGISSVEVKFSLVIDQVISLTVHEPDFTLKASKVSN